MMTAGISQCRGACACMLSATLLIPYSKARKVVLYVCVLRTLPVQHVSTTHCMSRGDMLRARGRPRLSL